MLLLSLLLLLLLGSCWYEVDDGKPSKTHQELPLGAKEPLVLIWLCPTECALDTSFPSLRERLGFDSTPVLEPCTASPVDGDSTLDDPASPATWSQNDAPSEGSLAVDDQQRLGNLMGGLLIRCGSLGPRLTNLLRRPPCGRASCLHG